MSNDFKFFSVIAALACTYFWFVAITLRVIDPWEYTYVGNTKFSSSVWYSFPVIASTVIGYAVAAFYAGGWVFKKYNIKSPL